MDYINSFWVGGLICAIAQIIIDKTKIMPARILVIYVISGAILGGLGIYQYIERIGGAGATVPIMGFGNTLAKGVIKAVDEKGFIGIFTGGVTAASGGICAAVFFGMLISLLFKPKSK